MPLRRILPCMHRTGSSTQIASVSCDEGFGCRFERGRQQCAHVEIAPYKNCCCFEGQIAGGGEVDLLILSRPYLNSPPAVLCCSTFRPWLRISGSIEPMVCGRASTCWDGGNTLYGPIHVSSLSCGNSVVLVDACFQLPSSSSFPRRLAAPRRGSFTGYLQGQRRYRGPESHVLVTLGLSLRGPAIRRAIKIAPIADKVQVLRFCPEDFRLLRCRFSLQAGSYLTAQRA